MKKIFALVLALVFILILAACNSNPSTFDSDVESTTVGISNNNKEISYVYNEESLLTAFCDGSWDGSLIADDNHCASIKDGILWLDCESTYAIPDIGPMYIGDAWDYELIDYSVSGSWVYNLRTLSLEFWNKGNKEKKLSFDCEDPYYTYLYKIGDVFFARYGEKGRIFDLDGKDLEKISDIIDVYQSSDGRVYFSNFDHQNFEITSSGEIVELSTTYVRFPRPQATIVSSENEEIIAQVSLLYNVEWDGTCRKIGNDFVSVDYNGNVILNNKWIGNISLGAEITADSSGRNIELYEDKSYVLDGTSLLMYEAGEKSAIDIPDGEGEIRWVTTEGSVVIWLYDGTLLIVEEGEVKTISTETVDMNVAYDTIYFMEGSTVYSLNWGNASASPEVFFEGAYAVSTHEDEVEGAIVPKKLANYGGYGYSNIYSPYGEIE